MQDWKWQSSPELPPFPFRNTSKGIMVIKKELGTAYKSIYSIKFVCSGLKAGVWT